MLAYYPPHRQLEAINIYPHLQHPHQPQRQQHSHQLAPSHPSPSTASSASSAASPSLPWFPYSDPLTPDSSSRSTFVFDDIFHQILSAAETDSVGGGSGGGYSGASSSLMAQHQQSQQQQTTNHSHLGNSPSISFHHSSPTAQSSAQSPPQLDWNLFGEDDFQNLLQSKSQPAPNQQVSAGQIFSTPALSPPSILASSYPHEPSTIPAFSKSLPTPNHTPLPEPFLAPPFHEFDSQEAPHNTESSAFAATKLAMYQHTLRQRPQLHQDSPSPNFSTMSGRRSISTAGQSSPLTPQTAYGDDFDDTLGLQQSNTFSSIPKFQTSLSEAGHDDFLYTAPTASASDRRRSGQNLLSPYQSTFNNQGNNNNNNNNNDRLQSGSMSGNSHLGLQSRSPTRPASRDASQYHRGPAAAVLSPTSNRFGVQQQQIPPSRLYSASQLREMQKAEAEAEAIANLARSPINLSAPNTISPKDSLLEYCPTPEDSEMPLFTPETSSQFMLAGGGGARQDDDMALDTSGYMGNFRLPPLPVQVPQHYPFIRRPSMNASESIDSNTPEFPAHLISMETSASDAETELQLQQQRQARKSSTPKESRKPDGATAADLGTYTCTYHGCPHRFETPAKLQKHKREGHRQLTPGSAAAAAVAAAAQQNRPGGPTNATMMTPTIKLGGSQAGPHKCDRVNPSTGKRCNTIFSRPYDLTRHEHTIHNVRKQKSRCPLCAEEKTFSRNDALTRHMRVVHPEVEFNPKSSRRSSR